MNDWVQRKPLRLRGYDYSKPGYYFVTVCTKVRGKPILSEIFPTPLPVGAAALGGPSPVPDGILNHSVNDSPSSDAVRIDLTAAGKIVKQHVERIDDVYGGQVRLDCYTIMPDHIHIIVRFCGSGNGPPRAAAPTVTLPGVINTLKGLSSKELGYPLWQRGYHDHIIRNENDLRNTREYIQNNPQKWVSSKE